MICQNPVLDQPVHFRACGQEDHLMHQVTVFLAPATDSPVEDDGLPAEEQATQRKAPTEDAHYMEEGRATTAHMASPPTAGSLGLDKILVSCIWFHFIT